MCSTHYTHTLHTLLDHATAVFTRELTGACCFYFTTDNHLILVSLSFRRLTWNLRYTSTLKTRTYYSPNRYKTPINLNEETKLIFFIRVLSASVVPKCNNGLLIYCYIWVRLASIVPKRNSGSLIRCSVWVRLMPIVPKLHVYRKMFQQCSSSPTQMCRKKIWLNHLWNYTLIKLFSF